MSLNAFDILKERGFVQQVTDEAAVRELFDKGPVAAYVGYDPTANSLHVGHLFTLMALLQLERAGHRPIIVLGGGTAMVGDPSGKTELRQMLDHDNIKQNLAAIRAQTDALFDKHTERGKGPGRIVVDNGEWLLELRYIDFLRDVGRHFSVNRMLSAEAYKLRLERGLSFIEFNYQILQAYDFLQLCKRYDCMVQMGGDDQWGNIVAGVDLVRRLAQKQVHGITFPLLLTATGEKMGKTAAGAVWLDPTRLSPYDYFQYWVNMHDDDVQRMLGYFTFLPMEEIRAVGSLPGQERNAAKRVLAFEATKLVHGVEVARKEHAASVAAFSLPPIAASILPSSDIPREAGADRAAMPTVEVKTAELAAGVALVALLVRAGLCSSNSEARRSIEQGGVRLAGQVIQDVHHKVTDQSLGAEVVELARGKKHKVNIVRVD